MAVTAATFPGTVTPVTQGGVSQNWTNPNNVKASDNTRATNSLVDGIANPSYWLDCTVFGFAVTGTVTNVEVQIERRYTATISGTVSDDTVKLIVSGTATGNNKASASAWPLTTDAIASYSGAPVAYWGLASLSAAEVNASNFGVRVAAHADAGSAQQAEIDGITLTITYSPPAGGPINTQIRRYPMRRRGKW